LRHHLDVRWLDTPQTPEIALAADGLDPGQCITSYCPVNRLLLTIPVSRGYTAYASGEVTRDLHAWGTTHSLLAGVELFQTASYSHLQLASDPSLTTDLFHPTGVGTLASIAGQPDLETYRNARERWVAGYVQNHVSFGNQFYLLIGVRFDSAWASVGEATSGSLVDGTTIASFGQSGLQIQMVKHREGLVWHPVPAWSFYALHTENFGAAPGLYVGANGYSGDDIPPQSATEWEAGLKFELSDGRFAATVAAFDLMKENVSSTILEPALDATWGASFFTGTVRNKGLEVDLHGEILPQLQCLANFAYIDSRISFGDAAGVSVSTPSGSSEVIGRTGNRFFGVPRNGGSAWCSYQFSSGLARGFKSGAGVIARGARAGDNANDYVLPGFARWNAFAAYEWPAWNTRLSVQLNVDNIFNTRGFESINGTHTVMPAYPRRWTASLRAQF
jgi:iron complex outermembrane receptor protein